MNMGKTKIMVGGLDFDLLKRSGKVPCGVCQKGVGIIAWKALGRDCTNNNEPILEIGVLSS